jgi:hypothetical protein
MNIKQLKTFLPFAAKANVSVMIHGLHGIGKSQAVKQYADENGMEFVDRRLSQMESGDLLGLPDLAGDTTTFKTPDWLPRDPNWKGVIFLDEINRARRDVLQGVFQLVLDRQLGNYRLPEGAQVVTAVNPNTDNYDTTNVFDEALLDRFLHIKLRPSTEEYFLFLRSQPQLDMDYVSFMQSNEDLIENSKLQDFSLDVKPSRRSSMKAAELLKLGLPEDIEVEAIAGLVGVPTAVAFTKWRQENSVKPFTAEQILNEYDKIADLVKKYSNPVDGRHDIINVSYQNLEAFIMDEKTELTKKQAKNLTRFVNETPKDCSYGTVMKIMQDHTNRDSINKLRDDVFLSDDFNEYFGLTPEILKEIDELEQKILEEAKKYEAQNKAAATETK